MLDDVEPVTCRLREIIAKVKNDDISKDVLVSNLEYVAKVLEATYVNETRYNSKLSTKTLTQLTFQDPIFLVLSYLCFYLYD